MIRGRARLRKLLVPAALAAAALVGTSCYYGPDASISHTTMVERGRDQKGPWGGILPWFCHSEGLGSSMDHAHDGLANMNYVGKKKGDLSWDDCAKVADFMDKAWATASKYPTRGEAKAAGAKQSVQFVPGLGTHDIVPGVSQAGFDPAHPLFLQYDGMGDTAKLAGMSWFVINGSDTTPPEGLPGDNDWWHTHSALCYKNGAASTVIGNEISDAQCTAIGGTNKKLPGVWMLHAWIVPGYEDQYDVFAGAYMCVKGTGPVAANDPCHDDHSDPEHSNSTPGTTPGTSGTATTPSTDGHGHTDADHEHINAQSTTTVKATTPTTDAHGHTDTDHANMTTTTTATSSATLLPSTTSPTTMPGMEHSHGN